MVDLSQFLTDGETKIRFGRLAEVGVGTVFGAVLSGIASVLLAVFDVPIALLNGLASFLGEVVGVLAGLPSVIIRGGFVAAVPFVVEAGAAGFLAALAVVLPTLYVVAEVVSRVGE